MIALLFRNGVCPCKHPWIGSQKRSASQQPWPILLRYATHPLWGWTLPHSDKGVRLILCMPNKLRVASN